MLVGSSLGMPVVWSGCSLEKNNVALRRMMLYTILILVRSAAMGVQPQSQVRQLMPGNRKRVCACTSPLVFFLGLLAVDNSLISNRAMEDPESLALAGGIISPQNSPIRVSYNGIHSDAIRIARLELDFIDSMCHDSNRAIGVGPRRCDVP